MQEAFIWEAWPFPIMEFFFDTTRAVDNLILHGIVHRYPNLKFIVPHAGAYLPILSDRFAILTRVLPADSADAINEADGQLDSALDEGLMKKIYRDNPAQLLG